MIPYTLKIIDSPQDIQKKIVKEIAVVLNKELPIVAKRIQASLRQNLGDFFYDSPEYDSILKTGRGEFGFRQGTAQSRMRSIIDTLQDTVEVRHRTLVARGTKLEGGLDILAFPDDFEYLFRLREAKVVTEKGFVLEWLKEMLLSGNAIIIAGWDVKFGLGRGRSGIANMVRRDGDVWRVPPVLAGTRFDNWITRSVQNSQKVIESKIEAEVKKEFSRI